MYHNHVTVNLKNAFFFWQAYQIRGLANLWIGLVIVSGIYLFFLLEYVMKMIVRFKEKSASENKETEVRRQILSSFAVLRLFKAFQYQPDVNKHLNAPQYPVLRACHVVEAQHLKIFIQGSAKEIRLPSEGTKTNELIAKPARLKHGLLEQAKGNVNLPQLDLFHIP